METFWKSDKSICQLVVSLSRGNQGLSIYETGFNYWPIGTASDLVHISIHNSGSCLTKQPSGRARPITSQKRRVMPHDRFNNSINVIYLSRSSSFSCENKSQCWFNCILDRREKKLYVITRVVDIVDNNSFAFYFGSCCFLFFYVRFFKHDCSITRF